jgi:hypothetical protein
MAPPLGRSPRARFRFDDASVPGTDGPLRSPHWKAQMVDSMIHDGLTDAFNDSAGLGGSTD